MFVISTLSHNLTVNTIHTLTIKLAIIQPTHSFKQQQPFPPFLPPAPLVNIAKSKALFPQVSKTKRALSIFNQVYRNLLSFSN